MSEKPDQVILYWHNDHDEGWWSMTDEWQSDGIPVTFHRAPEWVAVSERLPEDGVPVIGADRHHTYGSTIYYNGDLDAWMWVDEDKLVRTDTSHWMPLPPAPED